MDTKSVEVMVPSQKRDVLCPGLSVKVENLSDAEITSVLGESDLFEWGGIQNNVNLSLNKRRRWNAVESLKSELLEGAYTDDDFSVYVVEKVLTKKRLIKEITASKAESHKQLISSKKRENENSRLPRRKTSKGMKSMPNVKDVVSEDREKNIPPARELRLEVVTQCCDVVPGVPVVTRRRKGRQERLSAFSKTRKKTVVAPHNDWGDGGDGYDWGAGENDTKTDKSSKPKKTTKQPIKPITPKSVLQSLVFEDYSDLNDEDGFDNDLFEETILNDNCDDTTMYPELPKINIEDFINAKKPKRTKVQSKICEARSTKGNMRVVDRSEIDKYKPVVAVEKDHVEADDDNVGELDLFQDPPVQLNVTFADGDVTSESLLKSFGDKYIECLCYPRRFLVDLTDTIREVPSWGTFPHVRRQETRSRYRSRGRGRGGRRRIWVTQKALDFHTDFKKTELPVKEAGFLIFEERGKGVYRVTFESDSDVSATVTSKLSTAVKKQPTMTLNDLRKIVTDAVTNAEKSIIKVKQEYGDGLKFSTLKELLGWPEVDAYYPSPLPMNQRINSTPLVQHCGAGDGERCGICYEDMDQSEDKRGLALSFCGHWFCSTCWTSHVTTAVAIGGVRMLCPEFGCKNRVDEATLASLLTMRQLKVYRARLMDINLQTSGSMFWCPKPGCERIVSVRSESVSGTVRCACGATFCLKCRGRPHWPASCNHLQMYQSDLKRFSDDSMFSWTGTGDVTKLVKGKLCPACSSFIEKNQGCPNMVCICGHSFCWQCLEPWNTHKFNPICYGKADNHSSELAQDVYLENINKKPNSRTKAYMVALRSRRQQQTRKRAMLERHVRAMKKVLNGIVSRLGREEQGGVRTRGDNWRRHAESARRDLASGVRQGRQLLDWTLDLLFEIYHVVEYSAVLVNYNKNVGGRIPQHIAALSFFASRILTIFEDGCKQRMILVPGRLIHYSNLVLEILSILNPTGQLNKRS